MSVSAIAIARHPTYIPQNIPIIVIPAIDMGSGTLKKEYKFPRIPPITIPFSNRAVCFAVLVRASRRGMTPNFATKAYIPVATVNPAHTQIIIKNVYFSHIL